MNDLEVIINEKLMKRINKRFLKKERMKEKDFVGNIKTYLSSHRSMITRGLFSIVADREANLFLELEFDNEYFEDTGMKRIKIIGAECLDEVESSKQDDWLDVKMDNPEMWMLKK